VRLFARLFRLVWGSEADRALRPVLAVSVAGSTAFAAGWSFVGISAVENLGPSKGALGAAAVRASLGRRSDEPLPFVGA
jgi:hypothetical protein